MIKHLLAENENEIDVLLKQRYSEKYLCIQMPDEYIIYAGKVQIITIIDEKYLSIILDCILEHERNCKLSNY